ncbi:MAG TPA: GNAT family N-acetyltransferase [Rhodanobacteraceae bacterium]|jgi:ribosomal protein S18 acetylase RimI-like enzyme|nr:GNAT family N-acetyltransferase [Rhodanobacteraceae bacterium]
MPIEVSRATRADLDALTLLFDAYRVFYRQLSDLGGARAFVEARLAHHESEILLARHAGDRQPLGFTQLYPSFSSVSMRRTWVLNDLFVVPGFRNRGVARALMAAARELGRTSGALRLTLETADDNRAAQALYESLGYRSDAGMRHYSLPLE